MEDLEKVEGNDHVYGFDFVNSATLEAVKTSSSYPLGDCLSSSTSLVYREHRVSLAAVKASSRAPAR